MNTTIKIFMASIAFAALFQFTGCNEECGGTALRGTWVKDFDQGIGYTILESADGGYLYVNYDSFGTGTSLSKIDSAGEDVWSTALSGLSVVAEDVDGGLFVAGGSYYVTQVSRLNSSGGILWSRTFEGSGGLKYLVATSDGNAVATTYLDPDGNSVGNISVVKLDQNGTAIWTRVLDFSDDNYPHGVVATEDGGVTLLVEGFDYAKQGDSSKSSPVGISTFRLLRLAGDGTEEWNIVQPRGTLSGGSLAATNDGGCAILDYGMLVRFDTRGEILWVKAYESALGSARGILHAVPGGGFIVGSSSNVEGPGPFYFQSCGNIVLTRLDENGDITGEREYDTGAIEYLLDFAPTSDGGNIIVGQKRRGFGGFWKSFLLKVDGDGAGGKEIIEDVNGILVDGE
mgnify:CR=1 FL=1